LTSKRTPNRSRLPSDSAEQIEAKLGYRFKTRTLLLQALTHRSFGAANNEQLEFLGDSVLNCVIAAFLCRNFPTLPEGQLTRLRANLVREETLVRVGARMGVGEHLQLGQVEARQHAGVRPSIIADSVEAVFGAVFSDGGYDAACASILRVYEDELNTLDPSESGKDAKTRLQEYAQSRRLALPDYSVVSISGAAHEQNFEVACQMSTLDLAARGSGTSRQRAEQMAAACMLDLLRQ